MMRSSFTVFRLKYNVPVPLRVIVISVAPFVLFKVEPFISKLPVTVSVKPLKLIALPKAVVSAVMVTLFANTGLLAVLGIVTELPEVGTVAGVQLEAVFQSVLVLPFHVCACNNAAKKRAGKKSKTLFMVE